jgi:hypothetical protein
MNTKDKYAELERLRSERKYWEEEHKIDAELQKERQAIKDLKGPTFLDKVGRASNKALTRVMDDAKSAHEKDKKKAKGKKKSGSLGGIPKWY